MSRTIERLTPKRPAVGSSAPTVSVILTSYNQREYLTNAIESVLRQTYQDYEIIIVDDGSQDDSLQLVESIRQKHLQRIHVYTHEYRANRGIVETYRLGFSRSRGRYFAFLEADDYWTSNYLETKVQVMNSDPRIGVVFSPCKIIFDSWYGRDMSLRQRALYWPLPKEAPFDNFKYLLCRNNIGTFSAFMVRSSLAFAVERPPDPRLAFYDWWMLFHFSMRTSFYFDIRSFVWWRHHSDSFLGRQTFRSHKEKLLGFFDIMYLDIERHLLSVDGQAPESFIRKKRALPKFKEFYQTPSLSTFIQFFRSDPPWALESMVSYVVNSWKFSNSK